MAQAVAQAVLSLKLGVKAALLSLCDETRSGTNRKIIATNLVNNRPPNLSPPTKHRSQQSKGLSSPPGDGSIIHHH